MPCASWPALPARERDQARRKQKWLAKIREKNRRNQAALDLKKTRRRQSRPSRVRSEWLTSAGTTVRRTSSNRAGNGSPAGVVAPWFTHRRWRVEFPSTRSRCFASFVSDHSASNFIHHSLYCCVLLSPGSFGPGAATTTPIRGPGHYQDRGFRSNRAGCQRDLHDSRYKQEWAG